MTAVKPLLTIFTPSYNRAGFLPRLFESINRAVPMGAPVEWLIIDDGSNDGTPAVIAEFQQQRPELLRCLYNETGGKHRAINRAAQEASGDWLMIVDSDDLIAERAISYICDLILNELSDKPQVGVIKGIKKIPEASVTHQFELAKNPCRHEHWLHCQKKFDVAEVFRRDVLRAYPFPEYDGETFMAESWLWHQIDQTHDTWFTNEVLMVCFYQADGLSAYSLKNRIKSPCSAVAVYVAMASSAAPWRYRLRAAMNSWRFYFHACFSDKGNLKTMPQRSHLVNAVFGLMLFVTDLIRQKVIRSNTAPVQRK